MVETESSPAAALQSAIDIVGSQSELARRIGSTQGSVWRWLRGTPILAPMVLAIERETGVPKEALRPDLYPPELRPTEPAQ